IPGEASFATLISSFAVCFLARGTWASRSSPARGPTIFSGTSVIPVTFPFIPGESKITSVAPSRLRPSIAKATVLPRCSPAGQILETLGGILCPSARRDIAIAHPSAKDETRRKPFDLIEPPGEENCISSLRRLKGSLSDSINTYAGRIEFEDSIGKSRTRSTARRLPGCIPGFWRPRSKDRDLPDSFFVGRCVVQAERAVVAARRQPFAITACIQRFSPIGLPVDRSHQVELLIPEANRPVGRARHDGLSVGRPEQGEQAFLVCNQ